MAPDPAMSQPLLAALDDQIQQGEDVDAQHGRGGFSAAAALLFFYGMLGVAIYGVSYNLVLYMTTQIGLSNAMAAAQVNLWTFAHDLSPLLVAFIAEAYLGRAVATMAFALVFVAGLALLAAAAAAGGGSRATFFLALYMVALGKGMGAPLMAFSADQFDHDAVNRSSFFSWSYFSSAAGLLTAVLGIVYISDAVSFAAAIATSAAAAATGMVAHIAATTAGLYRYKPRPLRSSGRIQIANGALFIWLSSVVFETLKSQTLSLFIEQAATMDTSVLNWRIPPASLNCFDPLSVMLWTVVYDKIIRRLACRFTGNPKGLSLSQRMATGLLLMSLAMACAASLEATRLAAFHGSFGAAEKLSALWQVPQFTLVGASKVFYYVGLMEFMYEESPEDSKSIGSSLAFLSASFGSLVSGLLVSVTSKVTGDQGWIPQHLNYGHLDYFFWMLAGLGVANWLCFLLVPHSSRNVLPLPPQE